MRVHAIFLGTAAILSDHAFAAPRAHEPQGYTVSSRCYTTLGTHPPPYKPKTTYKTSYTQCMSTKTNTVTVTVTPKPSTSIVTDTETSTSTAPTSSLTQTSTVDTTVTATTTSTEACLVPVIHMVKQSAMLESTAVEINMKEAVERADMQIPPYALTDTATTTVESTSTSTSTVPTSLGFLAVQTTLPGSTYAGSGGPDPVGKRDLLGSVANLSPLVSQHGTFPHRYKQGVQCVKWTHSPSCATTTTSVVSTVTASTPTVTTTSTTTVVTVTVPSATTTVTTTQTDTTTSTATTTTITTSTSTDLTVVPTSVYAACATNNLADGVAGSGISGGFLATANYNEIYTITYSAYDCCVASITSNIAVEVFFWYGGAENYCFMEQTASGAAEPQALNGWFADLGGSAGEGYVIGNGYSGEFSAPG